MHELSFPILLKGFSGKAPEKLKTSWRDMTDREHHDIELEIETIFIVKKKNRT